MLKLSRVSGQTPRRSRLSPCGCVFAALRCGLWPCPAADKCGETRIASHPTPATACDYTSVLARSALFVVFQERENSFPGDGCSSGDADDAACARRDLRQGGRAAGRVGASRGRFRGPRHRSTSWTAPSPQILPVYCMSPPSSYAHLYARYAIAADTMSHLTILVRPGQRLARLPASARTQEIFLDSDGASRGATQSARQPRGATGEPPKGTPVGQVVLTGQTDRPEWISRWLEPP